MFGLLCAATTSALEVKPIPPPGVSVPDADRERLSAGVAALRSEIEALRLQHRGDARMLALLPDVMVFEKAVDWALRYNEFSDLKQLEAAKLELEIGMQRAAELRAGQASWNSATGLVVRGYVSKVDGSVQPYGLVIPEDWTPGEQGKRRLDFWFRGRADKSTELAFISDRLKNRGEFTPSGAIVLHPFGRFCCANKFAGEVDLFEAWEDAAAHYNLDAGRVSVRGFSMGGASAWQFGTHFAGLWAAVAPGAGFAETAEFNKVFAEGKTPPPWWEQVLYRWYDSTLYAANLANTVSVAYSGEIDGQKQAADIMLRYAEREGLSIPHVVGPQTAHKYHAESKLKIEEIVSEAVEKGRGSASPRLSLTTYSLVYPRMEWVRLEGMLRQWERADVSAEVKGDNVAVRTKNVSAVRLFAGEEFAGLAAAVAQVEIDGQRLAYQAGSGGMQLHCEGGVWRAGARAADRLVKRPDVCGPIDHAFMGSFVFVRPTGKALNERVGAWALAEMEHAVTFWRRVFRGDVVVKDDTDITAGDIASNHLVLWGDPGSNKLIARVLSRTPLVWDAEQLVVGAQRYGASEHAPVLIYPNPENPGRYLVMNSGPTFREEALLNNAQQVPKLPDWAVVNLNTPPDARNPGEVVNAGFFDENWLLPAR
jgi:hypothetical protein